MATNDPLRIGELAAQSGVTPDTLRYYERLGLMPRACRTAGGFRLFPKGATARVRFIKQAQANGLSLAEIRQLLACRDGGVDRCRRVHRLLGLKLAEIQTKLVQLREFEQVLRDQMAQCERALKMAGRKSSVDVQCPVVGHLESR